jgi:hypothetical protein
MLGDRIVLGISAVLGAQMLVFDDASDYTFGAGVGLLGDASVSLFRGFALTIQLGWIAQPLGGNDATDIHIPPSFIGGLGFAAWLFP